MTDDDITKHAVDRLRRAITADLVNRDHGLDDLKNLSGDQWPEEIRQERDDEGRPCLTINGLPQFLRQVTGDLRQMNPSINIIPADQNTSQETAELVEGLVRHIQYRSDASSVYESAAESAAACGMGFFRVRAEYEGPDTFNQEILVEYIHNPFSVYVDPDARKSTREDAMWMLITQHMTKEDFDAQYPGKSHSHVDQDGIGDGLEYWRDGDDVVIAEYFWKEPVKTTLGLLEDGTVVRPPFGRLKPVRTRKVTSYKVMWAKVSGADVLEGPQEIPCEHIPVVGVMGEELFVGTEVRRSSVIRFAKDPQRLYNYWRSAQTELVALQPKAPFLVTPTQISGFETFWNEANNSNRPYLPYKPDEKAANPPARAVPPIVSQGMMQEVSLAAEDMKRTTGIYNASLGDRSNETSGVAIRQRQMESDVSTSIYADNMGKAIAHCGRIIVDMIPRIYDTARVLRIVGEDDDEQMVPVNQPVLDQYGQQQTINDLTIGKYDVRVAVGPNYATKRQETAEMMMEFIKAFPPAGAVTADLVAQNMDWPGADKFAERLKKVLPPGIAEDQGQPDPMQAQQMQMQMQAQQAAQQMAQMAEQLKLRQEAAKAEEAEADAMRARFEAQKAQVELAMMASQPPQVGI